MAGRVRVAEELRGARCWAPVVVVGVLTLPLVAHAAGSVGNGAWSRQARAGGETWTYSFTVTGGPAANSTTPEGALAGGEVSRGVELRRDLARTNASVRRPPVGPRVDDGGAAAAVDIAVERAYTKTATGGNGVEVVAPVVGQTVYFYVDYSLTGATGVYIIARRAVFDGDSFCNATQTTSAGSYSAWCTNGWTATAGDHTLRWDFDYNDQLTESNENNNSATANWTSPAAAEVDLIAERAYLNTATDAAGDEVTTPAEGQAVYFHLDFSVTGGSGEAVTVVRRALIDGQTFCDFSGSPTPGAYLTWCTDPWTATAGEHTLRWDLDYNNTVAETDETNNSATFMFTAAAAGMVDLEAQRAYLNTMPAAAGDEVTTPAVGQAVYFHLDYSVIGAGGAVTVDRRAVFDDQTFCSFTNSPTPGDYLTWCVDSWTATAGSHTLRWDLDFNNTVPETNEDNNSASTTFTAGASACTGDCNGDHDVTVNELVTMVNVALGNAAAAVCSAGDANDDGEITVNEIVAGVNRTLGGCG